MSDIAAELFEPHANQIYVLQCLCTLLFVCLTTSHVSAQGVASLGDAERCFGEPALNARIIFCTRAIEHAKDLPLEMIQKVYLHRGIAYLFTAASDEDIKANRQKAFQDFEKLPP